MEQIDNLLGKTVTTLEGLVLEHGQEVVDLALLVYRVEAVKIIIIGLTLLAFSAYIIPLYRWVKTWPAVETLDEMPNEVAFVLLAVPGSISFFSSFYYLSNVYAWVGAFGYPEVFIAWKTLSAGGLI